MLTGNNLETEKAGQRPSRKPVRDGTPAIHMSVKYRVIDKSHLFFLLQYPSEGFSLRPGEAMNG